MFRRLLTEEEDRPVSFVDATAIEVCPADVSKCFFRKDLPGVPAHLKRAKGTGASSLFLVCVGIDASIAGGRPVRVPEYPPCTPSQFAVASAMWPCNYWRRPQDIVDFTAAYNIMKAIIAEPLSMVRALGSWTGEAEPDKTNVLGFSGIGCAGICIICDGEVPLYRALDTEYVFGHAILEAVRHVSKSKRGYLCTGYTAYIYREPCTSCAMALVHSRIKRVFCAHASTAPGSPYSGSRFNYNPHLNHRYPVYFYMEEHPQDGTTEE